ncbi:selenium metabolism-associated LysR family transcriptional regulator [Desulfoplanes sp. PS50]
MDIRRLEAFSKVFESRSFSRAAKELYLSQPTISSHVALLEEELGVLLFDRVGRSVLPTQAAEILYGRSQSIFHLLHLAHAEIDLLRHTVSGPIILGGSTIPADYVLPPLLSTFLRLYPDVRIDLRVGDTESVVEMVRRGDVMMAMVGSAADIRDLVFVPVLVDDPVLIGTHEQLQGITGSEKDLSFLSKLTWVMREPGSGTRQALESALKARGLAIHDLNVAIQVQNTQAMLGCVLAGLGVSVTSRMIVEPYVQRKEIQALALPSLAMSRSFYLVHHQKRELFPATRELQTFLTKTLAAGSITDV